MKLVLSNYRLLIKEQNYQSKNFWKYISCVEKPLLLSDIKEILENLRFSMFLQKVDILYNISSLQKRDDTILFDKNRICHVVYQPFYWSFENYACRERNWICKTRDIVIVWIILQKMTLWRFTFYPTSWENSRVFHYTVRALLCNFRVEDSATIYPTRENFPWILN